MHPAEHPAQLSRLRAQRDDQRRIDGVLPPADEADQGATKTISSRDSYCHLSPVVGQLRKFPCLFFRPAFNDFSASHRGDGAIDFIYRTTTLA